jgi:thiamine kinase-like enzyme
LRQARLDLAPQPLWLDETCARLPVPVVIYEWLPGTPLDASINDRQLAALLESIQQFHSLQPRSFPRFDLAEAFFHWFDFKPYIAEQRELAAKYGPWLAAFDPDGPALMDRIRRLIDNCAEAALQSKVSPGRDDVPLCLCRVDPNLANAIGCDDGRLRWVDWEYSGWGDPALDLADFRWHAAMEALSDEQHARLRDHYRRPADDPAFDERLKIWDCILVVRWPLLILRLLWSRYNGPDRVRLTRPSGEAVSEVRARLIRFIERAERLL